MHLAKNTGSCFAFGEYNFYCYFKYIYNINVFRYICSDIDFHLNSKAQIYLVCGNIFFFDLIRWTI